MTLNVVSVLVGGATRTGGPPAFVGGAALELLPLGASMTVLTTDLALAPTGWFQRQQRIAPEQLHPALSGADIAVLPARFPRRLAFSPALRGALEQAVARCDVVHIHNLWQYPQYAAYRMALARGVPYVVSPHGSLDPYLRRHGRLRKWLASAMWQREMLDKAALVHVTTRGEADLIADVSPHVPRQVVPCAIRTREFARLPSSQGFRRRHLGGYEGPLVLFFSRLTYKKGLDVLVRAFAHARRRLDCRLAIVGPDDEGLRPSLMRLAEELAVGSDVVFTGPLYGEERLGALASTDAWALSSYTENFGIAVVEAMAAGCAVVVSPAVNLADDIAAADAGLVADLAPERFGGALLTLLTDAALRAGLRSRARAFAARYDWDVVAPELMEMYSRVVTGAGPSRPRR